MWLSSLAIGVLLGSTEALTGPKHSRWQWQVIHHPPWCGTVVCTRGCGLTPARGAPDHPSARWFTSAGPLFFVPNLRHPARLATPSRNLRRHQAKRPKAKPCHRSGKRVAFRQSGASSTPLVSPLAFPPPPPSLTTADPIHLYQFLSCALFSSSSQRALISPLLVVCSSSAAAAVMEPLEVAITIIFDALLLVFMVKLFFAMFQMKLVVILFYLVILLFAMAFSGRAPSSF